MTTKVPVELSSTPSIVDGGNATAIIIDSSENVGIGNNASPVASASAYNTAAVHIHQSQSGSYGSQIHLTNAATGAAAGDGSFIAQWSDQSLYITNQENANIVFSANGSERMRIDSSGNVGIGNTASASLNEDGFYCMGNGENIYQVQNGTASSTYHVYDRNAQGYKFYVTYSGNIYATNTTVNGISDERLKENIKDLDQGLSDVLKLKPRKYDWKEGEGSGEKNVSGFVAQEAETAGFGEFVGNFKHNTLSDAKSFGQGGLIPVLTKAIQELSAKNDALEARIKTLEDA